VANETQSDKINKGDIEALKRRIILANTVLRPPRAAELLQISVRTLYRLDEEGLIKSQPLRPGQMKGKRYSLQALEDYRLLVMGDDFSPLDIPVTI
jgi:hypothetical protein